MSTVKDSLPQLTGNQALPATGERFLPTQMFGDIALEHLHRYAIARDFAVNKSVLDIASGEGYGTNLLANVANCVVGVDISSDAIAYAKNHYPRKNIDFRVGSCTEIPVDDHSIDLVVSFETLEHHDQHEKMLVELKRVLKPNGLLLISTPNKLEYTDHPESKNSYHVKELYLDEFSRLLAEHFLFHKILGQRIYHGSVIGPISSELINFKSFSGDVNGVTEALGMAAPVYYISLASDVSIDYSFLNILDGTKNFTKAYDAAILKADQLNTEVAHRDFEIGYRDFEIARMRSTFSWQITKPLRLLANIPRLIGKGFSWFRGSYLK